MSKSHTYIIAEIGPNHNGKLEIALDLIKKLASVGVDAVKFQLAIPENVYSQDAFKAQYQIRNENSKTPLEMAKKHQLAFKDHLTLNKACDKYGVNYLCTAFDLESLSFLDTKTNIRFFKIPSGEILTLDLLEYIANAEKPIILSTGMASYDEIELAVSILEKDKKKDISILHCVSNYPAREEEVNLNSMLELGKIFGRNIGFSDHTIGNEAAIAAVALGARIIEKHVTFDKNAEGPDHKASASVAEFGSLVKSIRLVEKMMGASKKVFSEDELEIKKVARKSIVTRIPLKRGDYIRREDICFKRPGTGYRPIDLPNILGKKTVKNIKADRIIMPDDLE